MNGNGKMENQKEYTRTAELQSIRNTALLCLVGFVMKCIFRTEQIQFLGGHFGLKIITSVLKYVISMGDFDKTKKWK